MTNQTRSEQIYTVQHPRYDSRTIPRRPFGWSHDATFTKYQFNFDAARHTTTRKHFSSSKTTTLLFLPCASFILAVPLTKTTMMDDNAAGAVKYTASHAKNLEENSATVPLHFSTR